MYYIGSHWGTEDDGYICSSNRMRDAYRRRPQDFKRRILGRFDNKHHTFQKEREWLLSVKNRSRYYNHVFDVFHWLLTEDTTKSAKEKMSVVQTGRKHSEETKAKISKANTGRVFSEEHRRKLSGRTMREEHKAAFSRLGYKHSDEAKAKMSAANKGHTISDEHRAIISKTHKGKIVSDESRERMSKSQQGPRPHRLKTYTFIDPNGMAQTTDNLAEFCAIHDLQYTTMIRLAKGKHPYKSYRGWTV